jgi:hypothetical protein
VLSKLESSRAPPHRDSGRLKLAARQDEPIGVVEAGAPQLSKLASSPRAAAHHQAEADVCRRTAGCRTIEMTNLKMFGTEYRQLPEYSDLPRKNLVPTLVEKSYSVESVESPLLLLACTLTLVE